MRYHLSSEQQALADAANGLLESCASQHRAKVIDGDTTLDTACWRRASVELGLPGVAVSEEHDGAGGSVLDAAVVLEVAGRTWSTIPLFASLVAGRILSGLADPERGGPMLADVATGTTVPGWIGLQPTHAIEATRDNDGQFQLSGRATHIVAGPSTDQFLVLTRTGDHWHLFAAAATGNGVTFEAERSLDPSRPLMSVRFQNTQASKLSRSSIDARTLDRVRAEVEVLLAAEQVGTAQGALDMAVEYAKTREQFGRPIGSFQSLKHLLADAYVDVATARDAMRYAAWALSSDMDDPRQTAHLTRASVTPRVQRVCAANLQVHGGIGYTWEHDAHLFYKRSISAAHLLGEVDQNLDAIADAVGLGADRF